MKYFFYRTLMKLAHRFDWHYAPGNWPDMARWFNAEVVQVVRLQTKLSAKRRKDGGWDYST